jgi:capsular polysaccharide biosynthesis protein
VHDHVVLPESFRNPVRRRLRSRTLLDWSQHSVRAPELAEPRSLSGTWFYLDNIQRGHFGHALTEQLSHVWGWEQARQRHPDLRALVFNWAGHPVADWELELFEAAGVPRDSITVLDEPARVETLVATTPAYAIGPYVHPEYLTTCHSLGRTLATAAEGGPRAERVFLTRRSDKRRCHNADEVEELFERHGFQVVLPERLPLPEQVQLVRSARVIAGFAGSAMFQLALAERPTHAIVIASETYPAANERQICAAAGHALDLVRCRSDVYTSGFSEASFHSDYTFDADREGAVLTRWLDEARSAPAG